MHRIVSVGLALALALAGCSSSGGGGGGGGGDDPLGFLVVLTAQSEATGGNGLWAYEIAEDGALDRLDGSPVEPDFVFPTSLALHPSSPLLFVGDEDEGNVHAFGMDENGSLTELSASPTTIGVDACQIVFSNDGESLLVAHAPDDPMILEMFDINTGTGALASVGTSGSIHGVCPGDVVAHPAQDVVYVSAWQTSQVDGYSFTSAGSFASVDDPWSVNDASDPRGAAITPDGNFLYVIDKGDLGPALVGMGLNANGSFATEVDDELLADDPSYVEIDPTGKFLYVSEYDVDTLWTFSINASTGVLTNGSGSPAEITGGPGAMAFSPDGAFMFMGMVDTGDVRVFSVNANTGVLTEISGSPFDGGVIPFALQVVQP